MDPIYNNTIIPLAVAIVVLVFIYRAYEAIKPHIAKIKENYLLIKQKVVVLWKKTKKQ